MAGLFGLIYTAFTLGTKAAMSIKDNAENEKYRQEAIHKNEQSYIDSKGYSCSVENGRRVMYANEYLNGYDKLPDKVLKYVDNGEIIKNFSKEEREQLETYYYNEAKKTNKTVYRIGGKFDNYSDVGSGKPKGYRYKDLNTNAIYVIRKFNGIKFYMDIKTGLLVRKTDGQIKREETCGNVDDKISPLLKNTMTDTIENINCDLLNYQKTYGLIDYQNNKCFLNGEDWYE